MISVAVSGTCKSGTTFVYQILALIRTEDATFEFFSIINNQMCINQLLVDNRIFINTSVEVNKAFTIAVRYRNPAADTRSLVTGAECSGAWESQTAASALPSHLADHIRRPLDSITWMV